MKRKKKLFNRPMKLYQKNRIQEENLLVKEYGLKNKREIWKTLAKISYFRKRAMALSKESKEEQEVFFNKLKSIGLNTESINDVLDLKIEDLLKRRLPTIVFGKKLAHTVKHARQMVVHKKIKVDKNIVDVPGYIVPIEMESKISVRVKKTAKKENLNQEQNSGEIAQ